MLQKSYNVLPLALLPVNELLNERPTQKHQSLYQHPNEDERITKLRKLNTLLGHSMDLERGAAVGSRNQSFDTGSGHLQQQQQLQQQRLHRQRELLRQQTINQSMQSMG